MAEAVLEAGRCLPPAELARVCDVLARYSGEPVPKPRSTARARLERAELDRAWTRVLETARLAGLPFEVGPLCPAGSWASKR
ncbi:MAG TPA: hypothetical protein RMG48_09255 [Myxococcales bacterium LLY-WYZ-16_1]|nr:hypothetical protein [Myxococcales bacterium LLY-WYZ-16_1]